MNGSFELGVSGSMVRASGRHESADCVVAGPLRRRISRAWAMIILEDGTNRGGVDPAGADLCCQGLAGGE